VNWYTSSGSGGQGLVIDEATGLTVAVAYKAEDAPLIAAAPTLLDALVALLPLQDREDVADEWSPQFQEARRALELSRQP
jgi:hypothetical protein